MLKMARENPGSTIALVGRSLEVVLAEMIEGVSGIATHAPADFAPKWYPRFKELRFPNGTRAIAYSSHRPDSIRSRHDFAWAHGLRSWFKLVETWDSLRYSGFPKTVATTHPRPLAKLREIAEDPHTHVTVGNTFENEDNLPKSLSPDQGSEIPIPEQFGE